MARARQQSWLLGIASMVLAALIAPTPLVAQENPPSPVPAFAPADEAVGPPAGSQGAPTDPAAGTTTAQAPPPPPSQGAEVTSSRVIATTAASKTVSVGDNFYMPKTISLTAGDTVKWTNDGQAPHTATAEDGSFDTGIFDPGQSRSQKFTSPGTIAYYCTVHGKVQSGTIKVEAAAGGGTGGNKKGSGSSGKANGDSAGSSGSGQTEASAVNSADAAGNESKLPATGSETLALAISGLLLLAAGLIAARHHAGRPPLKP